MAQERLTLTALREQIDGIDARIVELLAARMAVVDEVVAVKRAEGLPALIPERVEEVTGKVRQHAAAHGVSPELAETVWRAMMKWVIAYEAARLAEG